MEIASRTYESEFEVDQALNETLDGLAQERLFGGLKKLGKSLLKNKMLRGLAKKGLSIASGQFPALKAALSLAKGDLKGTLMNLGKQAITAAIPGSGAALGALNSLGFAQSESPEDNREAWENYVQMSGEAFEHLAANINAQSRSASGSEPSGHERISARDEARAAANDDGRAASDERAQGACHGPSRRGPPPQACGAHHRETGSDHRPEERPQGRRQGLSGARRCEHAAKRCAGGQTRCCSAFAAWPA